MLDKLERKYVELIREKAHDPLSRLFRIGMTPLSWAYSLCTKMRNFGYDQKLLNSYRADSPVVISVGNITVGGTGKTPVTLMLAKEFSDRLSIGILMRGYRGKAEKSKSPLYLKFEEECVYPPDFCGDEPYLLGENLPHASIFVGKNRKSSARMAARRGIDLLILDDGMQHRQLARDFEIVVIDASVPLTESRLLPLGFLREDLSSLKRADMIVLNHLENPGELTPFASEILKYSQAPCVATRVKISEIRLFSGGSLAPYEGKRCGIFCGIGNPLHFVNTLKKAHIDLVDHYFFKDHGAIEGEKLKRFADHCAEKGAEYLLCTEKDKVKIESHLELSLPLAWVKIELEIIEGAAKWRDFVDQTISLVNTKQERLRA